jgi:pathogenesis-related protein 1
MRSIAVLVAVLLCLVCTVAAQKKPKPLPTPVAKTEAIASIPARCPGNGLTEVEMTQILVEHNRPRVALGLTPLKWDCGIAASAQAWASKGKPGHNEFTPYGENIFVSSDGAEKVTTATTGWFAEKSAWANDTGACAAGKICTHYTQMIWRKTTLIGCGINRSIDGKWKALLVCNYQPAAQSGKAF